MKYFIRIDDIEEYIFKCEEIIGLDGEEIQEIDDWDYHKIEINNIEPLKEMKKNYKISYLTFIIISEENEKLAVIGFTLEEREKFGDFISEIKDGKLKLIGTLSKVIYKDEMKKQKRSIFELINKEEICSWIEIVKLFEFQKPKLTDSIGYKTIFIEGNNVKDIRSFFCAIGEAINGFAGYFGFDYYSFKDCFCGGFGVDGPFEIVWTNHRNSISAFNKTNWEIEKKYIYERHDKIYLNEDIEIMIITFDFNELVELIKSYGVTLKLD